MKKAVFTLVVLTFLVYSEKVRCQTLESGIFQGICDQIDNLNSNWSKKERLKGVDIIENPAKGEKLIKYDVETPEIASFNKIPHDQQQAILNAVKLPTYPLKDTIIIVDQNGIFNSGIHYLKNGHYFKTTKKATAINTATLIDVRTIGIRGKNVILTLGYSKYNTLTAIYFLLGEPKLDIERVINFDPNDMDY